MTRVKREDDAEAPLSGDLEEVRLADRIDLADLNTPGDPVSSCRKPDPRLNRQWKQIELWFEQDVEEILIVDEESDSRQKPVAVKMESQQLLAVGLGLIIPPFTRAFGTSVFRS